ncbi:MAG TPA: hypothetical protein VNZ54_00780 [bacterium]|nr:hypothetical protein [bacterium]HXB96553.1 hypothetical protein [bacterium]
MTPSYQYRRPGLRSLGWALAMVIGGALLGLGLNHVSSVGINMTIALGLDEPSAPAAPAAGAKP